MMDGQVTDGRPSPERPGLHTKYEYKWGFRHRLEWGEKNKMPVRSVKVMQKTQPPGTLMKLHGAPEVSFSFKPCPETGRRRWIPAKKRYRNDDFSMCIRKGCSGGQVDKYFPHANVVI